MIVTPAVEDANVKVVGIIAFPGAIVMDRLTTALTFCVIWWNPTIRLLLACLASYFGKSVQLLGLLCVFMFSYYTGCCGS